MTPSEIATCVNKEKDMLSGIFGHSKKVLATPENFVPKFSALKSISVPDVVITDELGVEYQNLTEQAYPNVMVYPGFTKVRDIYATGLMHPSQEAIPSGGRFGIFRPFFGSSTQDFLSSAAMATAQTAASGLAYASQEAPVQFGLEEALENIQFLYT